jgi:Zn-dependent protease with chaperone function
MPFLLLLFLTLACLPEEWPAPWGWFALPQRSVALTWVAVALVMALARGISVAVNHLLAADPSRREAVLHRYSRWRLYHVLTLLAAYALSLYVFGWGWAVQSAAGRGHGETPGAELLILLPFFASLVLSWVCFYDAERALHDAAYDADPFWSRGAYVSYHLRQNLALVFVPVLLLVLLKGLHRLLPEGDESLSYLISLAVLGVAVAVFVAYPWVLRLLLGLKPLPPGPLRDRLLATARRLRFRSSNVLLWNTRGGVANAMVAGVVPWVRYVLLTDRLLADLTPDEIEAVFGHEIGHVKHHHMLFYLGFLNLSLVLLWGLWACLAHFVPFAREIDMAVQALPIVTLLGAYIFVVFGFLSRRCERQADIYGCRAVSCDRGGGCSGHGGGVPLAPRGSGLCPTGIRTFIEALEKVARLNGIPRERPGWLQSWQHSTIARRVEFLQRMLADPTLEPRFQRRVALVKWGLLLGLAAALALLLGGGWADAPDVGAAPPSPTVATPAGHAG